MHRRTPVGLREGLWALSEVFGRRVRFACPPPSPQFRKTNIVAAPRRQPGVVIGICRYIN